jgi:hypothetical protein
MCTHEEDFLSLKRRGFSQDGSRFSQEEHSGLPGCETKSLSTDQCKPKVGFGMASISGIKKIGDSVQQVVQFKTNCYYKKFDRPQRLMYGNYGPGWYENCFPNGCSQSDNSRGKKPGSLLLPSSSSPPADALILFKRRIEHSWAGESFVTHYGMLIPDIPKTCIDLGNKKVLNMNLTSCPINRVAECTYAADTIAGGCADGECVRRGFNTFMSEVNGMMGPQSSTLDDRGKAARNLGLARLVEGLTEKGKCGEPNATCLQKLDLSCAFIAEAASEIQPQSQILYESLVRAQQVCSKGL